MHGPDTGNAERRKRRASFAGVLACAGLIVLLAGGCASKGISLRSAPSNPLSDQLRLTSYWGPKPSDRTMQVLRVCNLEEDLAKDRGKLLEKLHAVNLHEPTPETVYAMAELAYLGGKETESSDKQLALSLFGASVINAYQYLFDSRFAATRNPYDPQFRGACNLYNSALEGALRIECAERRLLPGTSKIVATAAGHCEISCVLRGGRWRPEDFDHFEFCSDYEIKNLKNHYLRHGLGVPLIAVRRTYEGEPAAAKYYPLDLSFPVTAFLRPLPTTNPAARQRGIQTQGLLELYDPVTTGDVEVAGTSVPLESDLTTPLAYFLSKQDPNKLATIGLLNPEALMGKRPDGHGPITGLYMVQPYEPDKIPVVMVHGLWSSPMTWMEMFNDLRSSQAIRDNYQFWFYLYPTGEPFWQSAAQMRRDLAEARAVLDPRRKEPALDQMVLVGHSMGGLVSRLQTLQSRDDFWKLVSNAPLEQIKADPATRQQLRDTYYFLPNPSIRRVVTIGTPHRGSRFSNETTQWLLRKLTQLPSMLLANQQSLMRDNKGLIPSRSLLRIETSVESLAPDAPIFPVMLQAHRAPWVKYHNIVGNVEGTEWLKSLVGKGDGVVELSSALTDDAETELAVPADHSTIHAHPLAVLEVRQILLNHLAELRGHPTGPPAAEPPGVRTARGQPTGWASPVGAQ